MTSKIQNFQISRKIYTIRGQQVMLSIDLAKLYEVEIRILNQAVKRNIHKFPPEFMFQLTSDEFENLRSQIATSRLNTDSNLKSQFVISSWGGRRYPPYAFTEHGVIMLASVLNSPIAIKTNIAIIKSFVSMRNYLINNKNSEIEDIKRVLMLHIDDTNHNFELHTNTINEIIEKLNFLIENPKPKRRKIGFCTDNME